MSNNNSSKKDLHENLERLKQERQDLDTYQSVFGEVDAMDHGPRYQERADEAVNNLYDRTQKINEEIEDIENKLNQRTKQ